MQTKKYRAAIVPYIVEGDKIHMMFMLPSNPKYGGNHFQLCKGKIEDGETPQQAAVREGQEELGLFAGNITRIDDLGVVLGRTTLFAAQVKDRDMFGDPHFETKETRWMTPEEFQAEGRDIHKPVVKAVVRFIQNL